jgi:two-component system CheB/CheR fusion protein
MRKSTPRKNTPKQSATGTPVPRTRPEYSPEGAGIEAGEQTTPAEPAAAGKESPAIAFPVVGLGASAGGLTAFESFFAHLPTDTGVGMAFVVVQHLDPDHKSILAELVRRYTRMKVYEVEDGMQVMANCTYIIPPNKDMGILHDKFHLMEPTAPRGLRLPIDFFFRSLAHALGDRAICIVLSGTGTDGTLGLCAVKETGGMTMVQLPESADYDGMPRSAIGTGLADYVLPPHEMPAQLIAYTQHAFRRRWMSGIAIPKMVPWLQKIFILLRTQSGHDFSSYKQSTILRRIERRMVPDAHPSLSYAGKCHRRRGHHVRQNHGTETPPGHLERIGTALPAAF